MPSRPPCAMRCVGCSAVTTRRAVLLGAGAAVLLPAPALAHRVNRAETTVEFSSEPGGREDGYVSVTHIFHAADAQDALYRAGLIKRPDIADLRARARLALHVEETFQILVNEVEQPLSTVGAEIIGNNVYVYQEATGVYPGQLHIRAGMLHGLVRGHRNDVTVVMGPGRRKTFEMTEDDTLKEVVL